MRRHQQQIRACWCWIGCNDVQVSRTAASLPRHKLPQRVGVRNIQCSEAPRITVISEDADVRMGRKDKECGAIGVMSVAGTSGETC